MDPQAPRVEAPRAVWLRLQTWMDALSPSERGTLTGIGLGALASLTLVLLLAYHTAGMYWPSLAGHAEWAPLAAWLP